VPSPTAQAPAGTNGKTTLALRRFFAPLAFPKQLLSLEEVLIILFVLEDRSLLDPPNNDMVDHPGRINAW